MTDFVRLGDIASSSYGLTASASDDPTGHRFLRITDIVNGIPGSYESVPFVDVDESSATKYRLNRGDIVVARTGATVGATHWFRGWYEPVLYASYLVRFIPNPSIADSRFVGYALQSPAWDDYVYANAFAKSAQPNMSAGVMADHTFRLPPLHEQKRIGQLLGALDDKIVANQKAILQLDKLRHALWQRNLQAGAFPKPLSSLASFVNGGAFTKNATGTGRVVVRIAELTGGIGGSTVRNVLDVPDNQVVRNGDLLFSWSGTLMVKRWPLGEAIVNQHIFKVVPDPDFPAVFLDCAIDQQLDYFRMIAAGKATTMGHIKRSDLDAEVEIPVQIREDDLQLSSSLWDTAVSLEKENVSLAKTRDELLPLLMSGKIS
uniref:restriction endonuclease subunit S n=1 Tax=Corynebacterium appendicis TaxID=163202 RepID=UPI002357B2D1